MSSDPSDSHPARRRQSIPLQTLGFSPDGSGEYHQYEARAQRNPSRDASPATARMAANLPGISTYWDPSFNQTSDDGISLESPIDPAALQGALPPDLRHHGADVSRRSTSSDMFDHRSPYIEEVSSQDYDDSDRAPLTAGAQDISGSLAAGNHDAQPRDSFQTVSDVDNDPARGRETRSLGHDLEFGRRSSRHRSYGMSLAPNEYRVSHSPSRSGALLRAGSIVRAMSQRVVNISGESEVVEQQASQRRSRSPRASTQERPRDTVNSMFVDTAYRPQSAQSSTEKTDAPPFVTSARPMPPGRRRLPNPLKGMSLGVFAPDNRIRVWLCDLLVKPYTEPAILLLIVAQTVLLAIESAPDVFSKGNGRPERWGTRAIDWAMLGLFIVFTLELFARIIVSGLVLNAAEHSTIDRKKGIRAAFTDQYKAIFQPQRQKTIRGSRQSSAEPPAFVRSFTTLMQGQEGLPETFEDQQRFQLARRAFLRHSFNRLDVVAVLAFWIHFGLAIAGLESQHHIYVFKMMSCLRILRLLALTHGTAVRSTVELGWNNKLMVLHRSSCAV